MILLCLFLVFFYIKKCALPSTFTFLLFISFLHFVCVNNFFYNIFRTRFCLLSSGTPHVPFFTIAISANHRPNSVFLVFNILFFCIPQDKKKVKPGSGCLKYLVLLFLYHQLNSIFFNDFVKGTKLKKVNLLPGGGWYVCFLYRESEHKKPHNFRVYRLFSSKFHNFFYIMIMIFLS